MCTRVSFLGLTLTKWDRTPSQQKVEAIQKFLLPEYPAALRSFLGFTGFHRDFIPNSASIAGPLYQLLKKSVQREWTEQHPEAVSQRKQAIVKALVLINPNPEIPLSPGGVSALVLSAPKRGMGRSDPRPKPHV
ncbi:unnamed protein product [Natator depressus]